MMRNALRSLAGLVLLAPAMTALAQSGIPAPGAEHLPPELRQHAFVPLVLTPVSSPQTCLETSLKDESGRTAQLHTCQAGWHQSIWMEAPDPAAPDAVRLRIGTLACVVSARRSQAAVSMGICGDNPAGESWRINDTQLVDAAGLCLEAAPSSTAPALRPISAPCKADEAGQSWQVEPMRTALDRVPGAAPIAGTGRLFERGFLRDVVEELRPRFSSRELSREEQQEVRKLRATWKHIDVLDQEIALKDYKRGKPITVPWPVLARLGQLAESGDRDAMEAVLEGFSVMIQAPGEDRFKPWKDQGFPRGDGDYHLSYFTTSALANLWGAHYWQRHGPHRLAAKAFWGCPEKNDCLGYSATLTFDDPEGRIYEWVATGKRKHRFTVSNLVFRPVAKTPGQLREEFIAAMKTGTKFGADPQKLAEAAAYASKTGQLALWDAVTLNTDFSRDTWTSRQELAMRETLKARSKEAEAQARFAAVLANPDASVLDLLSTQTWLRGRSDADLLAFAERHLVTHGELVDRLCAQGRQATPGCVRARDALARENVRRMANLRRIQAQLEAERQANIAKQAQEQADREANKARLEEQARNRKKSFWDSVVSLAEGFDAAMQEANRTVTVREYDAAGNFTGTREMTRSQAIGLGATPQ